MERQKTFFIIDNLIFEVQKPEITVEKIKVAQEYENEEYKVYLEKNLMRIFLI
ncbi:hypothetical protein M3226_03235 [Neobacillus cucumis]|uniref:hypothetical protein n=1 Tax=Neobacillus cucumis TaxID=1740721 RepID=UPI00203B70F8|nr:hypothetical protein [Neobacillus cucumis]MCM3724710.1 hypothetical protein [Neobacillus cucumis]